MSGSRFFASGSAPLRTIVLSLNCDECCWARIAFTGVGVEVCVLWVLENASMPPAIVRASILGPVPRVSGSQIG